MTIQGADGQERPLVQSFVNLEAWVLQQQQQEQPIQTETVQLVIDAKIRSAIIGLQTSERQSQTKQEHAKPILESKAAQDIGKLTDAKSYRRWNKKMKNELEQTREQSRGMLEVGKDDRRRNHPTQLQPRKHADIE